MPDSKPIYKSKTFWTNMLGGAALLLGGPLGVAIPPKWAGVTLAAVNIALRTITDQPVTMSGSNEPQ